jgi:hypothetical protein
MKFFMNRMLGTLMLAAAWPLLVCQAAEPMARDALVFGTQVAIEVDAQGKVVAAAADAKLPPALRAEIERVAGTWRFAAPRRGEQPVAGKTYADVGVCGLPEGENYQFAFAYRGNGPGRQGPFMFPKLPREVVQAAKMLDFTIRYRVLDSGKVELVSITHKQSPGRFMEPRIERAVRQWLDQQQYQPEVVDGQSVTTLLEMRVTYSFDSAIAVEREMRRHYATLPECLAANSATSANDGIALDSPFKKVPSVGSP